jgi:hypothetical protein
MSELVGPGSAPLRARQREIPIDRSRQCFAPHPTPEQLEELGGKYDCPSCTGAAASRTSP